MCIWRLYFWSSWSWILPGPVHVGLVLWHTWSMDSSCTWDFSTVLKWKLIKIEKLMKIWCRFDALLMHFWKVHQKCIKCASWWCTFDALFKSAPKVHQKCIKSASNFHQTCINFLANLYQLCTTSTKMFVSTMYQSYIRKSMQTALHKYIKTIFTPLHRYEVTMCFEDLCAQVHQSEFMSHSPDFYLCTFELAFICTWDLQIYLSWLYHLYRVSNKALHKSKWISW